MLPVPFALLKAIARSTERTITVKNNGKGDAENVTVKDFFDGKGTLNFVAMDGVTDNGDDTYTIASVKAGESVTLNFTYVVVDGDAPERGPTLARALPAAEGRP